MNKFYSIKGISDCLENTYQLRNLGEKKIGMSIGFMDRDPFSGKHKYHSNTSYQKVTPEDYDGLFATTLLKIKPPYEIDGFLEYHLNYFITKVENNKELFLKHMKYVIMPIIKNRIGKENYVDFFNNWLEENGMNSNNKIENNMTIIKTGDINAPLQIQQNVNSSQQSQQISYTNENISELFEILKKDFKMLSSEQIKEFSVEMDYAIKQLNKGNEIRPQLTNIGSLIKTIGIGIFSNLISSPIFEIIKPYIGL